MKKLLLVFFCLMPLFASATDIEVIDSKKWQMQKRQAIDEGMAKDSRFMHKLLEIQAFMLKQELAEAMDKIKIEAENKSLGLSKDLFKASI